MSWGSPAELETRARIQIAVAAYAYEIKNHPLIDDATYDKAADEIDLSVDTARPDLDQWFRENFAPHTGQWIHNHPELDKIAMLYNGLTRSDHSTMD
jgi:hypothetical protein